MKPTNYRFFYIPAALIMAIGLVLAILPPSDDAIYSLIAIVLACGLVTTGSIVNYRPKK